MNVTLINWFPVNSLLSARFLIWVCLSFCVLVTNPFLPCWKNPSGSKVLLLGGPLFQEGMRVLGGRHCHQDPGPVCSSHGLWRGQCEVRRRNQACSLESVVFSWKSSNFTGEEECSLSFQHICYWLIKWKRFDGDILGLPASCALYLLDEFVKCCICHRLPVTLTLNRGWCCCIQRDILMGAGE